MTSNQTRAFNVDRKTRQDRSKRTGLIGALATVLAGAAFLVLPLGDGLIRLSYDLPFGFVAPQHFEDVVIVYMDDDSAVEFGQQPGLVWDRTIHERLVRRLTAQGAKAVVFDVLFDLPSTNRNTDQQFAAAIREHGKVVLAAVVESTELGPGRYLSQLRPPVEPLAAAAAGLGAVEFVVGTDQAIRQHHWHQAYPGLAWQLAEILDQTPPNRERDRWLKYYGERAVVPHLKYHEALSPELPGDFFTNRIAFVGLGRSITAEGTRADEYRTPYTRWTGTLMPGVEIQATAYLNLVRRDWLARLSGMGELLLVVIVGAVFGFGLNWLRPQIAGWLSLAALLGTAATAALAVRYLQFWFPWLIPCVVQIPWALAWATLANTQWAYRYIAQLERTLADLLARRPGAIPPGPVGSPVPPPPHADSVPPTIPNYTLVQFLGKGAYGRVWLARDLVDAFCVVKVVRRDAFEDAEPYEREFKGLSRFMPICRDHPSFIDVLTIGRNEAEGFFYYVMERADHEDGSREVKPDTYAPKNLAREIQRRGHIPVAECLHLGCALADALGHLHDNGLIHRDIKPSNIIFVRGQPKIIDIGCVTEIAARPSDVSIVGTFIYMAPEGPGQPRADIYSLGKVLYEAATGSLDEFPLLPGDSGRRADYPQLLALYRCISRATEPDPAGRYQQTKDLIADLRRLQEQFQTQALG